MGKQKLQRCKLPVDSINIKEEQSCASKLPTQSWRTSVLGCNIQGFKKPIYHLSFGFVQHAQCILCFLGRQFPFSFPAPSLAQQSSYNASAACLALEMAGHLEQHS